MIRAARRAVAPAPGRSVSVPAPVGGWNARDALANMPATDAVSMTNWFPQATYAQLRNGYTSFATGITGWVETIMAYVGGTSNKLFAAAGTVIYDITAGGTASSSVTSLTNARWQYVNNTTSGGSYIQAVNGADYMRVFDGTNWHKDTDGVPYNVTGVDTRTCIGITLAHNRVWLTQLNSLKAWYGPTGAIGGAFNALDLSSFCVRGGYLMTIAAWTMDAGYGMDDMTAFITSKGEVLVYRGSDPSSVSTWALIGVFWIGSPVGRRCTVKYSGDLLIITRDGVQPMSLALQSSRGKPTEKITDKIQQAVSQAVSSYASNYGWQLLPFPNENMLIVNVPLQESAIQQQYVMNTITKSWCNFTGWNAACWELYEDNPYFGGNGYVGKAWNGLSDAGGDILGNCLQAFNYFKAPGTNKQYTNIRPVFYTNGTPTVSTQVNVDFDLSDPTASASFTPTNVGLWGTGVWGTSLWGGSLAISQEWQGANGVGRCAAPHVIANCQGFNLQWMSTDIIWRPGGLL
tara:strand:- start:2020 stop:3570 length:1551 start_codon:yes stop_codon:yes gene_type:complete